MLSVNISAYKGDIPRNHVLVSISFFSNHFAFYLPIQDIIKRYRFDLPPGIEHDYASWEKISQAVSYFLTQSRARVKKLACDIILINFLPAERAMLFLFCISGQGKHQVQHQYICARTVDCPRYALSTDGPTLRSRCPHGKYFPLLFLVMLNCFSVQFMSSAPAVKSTGI
jgi:hypothetical protein